MPLPYSKAKNLIEEGDILLFKGHGFISKLITQVGKGIHSHAAMASWHNNLLECVEFREFRGGRAVSLYNEVDRLGSEVIDVFRPIPKYHKLSLIDGKVETKEFIYDGKAATNYIRQLTGLPYGYKRILILAERYMPFIRWMIPPNIDDDLETDVYPVCSTAVGKTMRAVYVDPVPYKPDCYVEPPDLARSSLLNYLFTIEKDW